jgi:hypothetical protein
MFDNNVFNRTYRSNIAPEKPYRYITASLDLSGALNGETMYFNLDNSFEYIVNRDYKKYIILTQDTIVNEVIVWADPVILSSEVTANGPIFNIGGAETLKTPVVVPYAAPIAFGPKVPPQFSGAPVDIDSLNAKTINYFGHSAAKFPYGVTNNYVPDSRTNLNYLAITISNPDVLPLRRLVDSGIVHVQIRIHPK